MCYRYNPAAVGISPSVRTPDRTLYALRALGRADLPLTISVANKTYVHEETVKHDFFAATGFYRGPTGDRVVLKLGRTQDYAGIPLLWLGRWLCEREMRFYRATQDLPNVPKLLGKVGQTGFVHAYVFGRPLSREHPIPDTFFDELLGLLRELHRRRIAYVDTNKPQNILQGEDNHPYLIDFQISFDTKDFGDNFITRAILRRLQDEDLYHILKHKRKLRPDLLTPEERAIAERKSWAIKLHRWVTRPYFLLRRSTFKRLKESGQLAPEGSK